MSNPTAMRTKMETAESKARALVERTRRRAFRHTLLRAFLRAVAVGLFLASLAIAAGRLAGIPPGRWLLVILLPAQVVAVLSVFRGRATSRGAALLLDRETGAAERFTAVVLAEDPEIRELAARQALAVPAVREKGSPVRYPPSREGLGVALGLFLLVLALVLTGAPPGSGEVREAAGRSSAGAGAAAGGNSDTGSPDPAEEASEVLARLTRHVDSGEDVPEELWSDLGAAGADEELRAAVLEALARGDQDGALDALSKASGGGSGRTGTETAPGNSPSGDAAELRWDGYEAALATPHWDPRYDDIVRRYFEEGAR